MLLPLLASASADPRLVGVRLPLLDAASKQKAAIVAIWPSNGTVEALVPYDSALVTHQVLINRKRRMLHLVADDALTGGAAIKSLDLHSTKWLPEVQLDISKCEGAGNCFSQFRWDAPRSRIVAIASGFAHGGNQTGSNAAVVTNAVVAIDPSSGVAKALQPFPKECGTYLFSGDYDESAQVVYSWLSCPFAPPATAQLVAFDLSAQTNKTLLVVDAHNISAPCVFVPGHGLVAVAADGTLVQIDGATGGARTLSGVLGGIPSNNGLVWSNASGAPTVYSTLVNMGANKLAAFNLKTNKLSVRQMDATVSYPQMDDA